MSTNPNVLFLNHKVHNYGVYQYGKRVFEILEKDTEINYIYCEVDCLQEFIDSLSANAHTGAIIYNYHACTMSWLNKSNIQTAVKNIGIPHESPDGLFDIVLNIDPNEVETETRFSLPRPIFENIDEIDSVPFSTPQIGEFISTRGTDLPVFGSFRFGFESKGFDKIITMVNDQYDNAIIKFVIPHAHFDGDVGRIHRLRLYCTQLNRKPGILLMITHDFFSTTDILRFLKSNTMNIFLYDKLD